MATDPRTTTRDLQPKAPPGPGGPGRRAVPATDERAAATTSALAAEGEQPEPQRLQLSPTQVAGSALAATTSAFAASSLGVAGTLIGAAVGSVVATTGSAVYTYFFRRTGETVKTVVLRTPGGEPMAVATTAEAGVDHGAVVAATERALGEAAAGAAAAADSGPALDEVAAGPPEAVTDAPRRLDRRAVVASVVGVFVLALGVLTGVELLSGQPVGSAGGEGGRTTLSTVFGSTGTAEAPSDGTDVEPGEPSDGGAPAPVEGPTTGTTSPSATEPTPGPTTGTTPAPEETTAPDPGSTAPAPVPAESAPAPVAP